MGGARMSEALLRQAEAEVRVVGQRVTVDDLAKAVGGELMVALVEVGASQRLEDRGLAGLEPAGTLEEDGGGAGMPFGEQSRPAAEELVGGVAVVRGSRWRHGLAVQVDPLESGVVGPARDATALGDRQAVELLEVAGEVDGLASLIADPTANESTGAPDSLK